MYPCVRVVGFLYYLPDHSPKELPLTLYLGRLGVDDRLLSGSPGNRAYDQLDCSGAIHVS